MPGSPASWSAATCARVWASTWSSRTRSTTAPDTFPRAHPIDDLPARSSGDRSALPSVTDVRNGGRWMRIALSSRRSATTSMIARLSRHERRRGGDDRMAGARAGVGNGPPRRLASVGAGRSPRSGRHRVPSRRPGRLPFVRRIPQALGRGRAGTVPGARGGLGDGVSPLHGPPPGVLDGWRAVTRTPSGFRGPRSSWAPVTPLLPPAPSDGRPPPPPDAFAGVPLAHREGRRRRTAAQPTS